MKLCDREGVSEKTLASYSTFFFANTYNFIAIILLLFCVFFMMLSNFCYASESAESFYDYVRDERLKEISEGRLEDNSEPFDELIKKRNSALFFGRVASISLTLLWCFGVYCFKNRQFLPFKKNREEHEVGLSKTFFTKKPVEVSAIVNLNKFTQDDLMATIFDLIRQGILIVSKVDGEYRIYLDIFAAEERKAELENYEGFLIRWLITKIGGGEYFCIRKLADYLKVNSQASEFDIDYDIWLDELNDFAEDKQIVDKESANQEVALGIVGAAYAFFGILLLYLTGSSAVFLLFGITFLSYRLSFKVVKRTEKAENECIELLHLFENIEKAIDTPCLENNTNIEAYFVYSICIGKKEFFLKKYEKYAELYHELDERLSEAIIYASGIINSPLE